MESSSYYHDQPANPATKVCVSFCALWVYVWCICGQERVKHRTA